MNASVLSPNAAAFGAHFAARDEHAVVVARRKRAGNFRGIGDDRQPRPGTQRVGDMHAGRAAVEYQRVTVAHQIAHARCNDPLRLKVLLHAALKRRLVEPVRQHHPAMHLDQHTFRNQRLDVAADGFVGHGEDFGQLGDRAGLLRPHEAQDFRLALGRKHTGRGRIKVAVSLAKALSQGKPFPQISKQVNKA
jgi:hypothetical protein